MLYIAVKNQSRYLFWKKIVKVGIISISEKQKYLQPLWKESFYRVGKYIVRNERTIIITANIQ